MLAAGFIALLFAYLLPGHYPPWASFEQQFLAAIGCALVAGSLSFAASRPNIEAPWLAWVVAVSAAIPVVQLLFGQILFASDALLSSAYLLGFALSVAAGAMLRDAHGERFFNWLGAAFVAAGILSTALAAMQWLGQTWGPMVVDLPPGGRPYANLAQPNHLATLLLLSLAFAVRAYELRQLSGVVTATLAAWLGFGIVMTQSRTGWAGVVLMALWWAVMRRRAHLSLSGRAVLCGTAAFAAAVLLWQPLNDALFISGGEALNQRLQPGTRWLHWQTLLDALRQHPWVGFGWSQVVLAQQAAILAHPASGEWLTNSHNILLDLLLWNGVPLGLLLACCLCTWLVLRALECRTASHWSAYAAVAAVFWHSLLEYPLDYAYFLFPVGLLMGALEASQRATKDTRSALPAIPKHVYTALLGVAVATTLFVGKEYVEVQNAARQLRFVAAGIGVDAVPSAPVPDVLVLDGPRELHRFLSAHAEPGMTEDQLDWMQRVASRYPTPPAMLRTALANGLNGRPAKAREVLARLCKMHSVIRCREGRESWRQLVVRYPQLGEVPYPPDPAASLAAAVP